MFGLMRPMTVYFNYNYYYVVVASAVFFSSRETALKPRQHDYFVYPNFEKN